MIDDWLQNIERYAHDMHDIKIRHHQTSTDIIRHHHSSSGIRNGACVLACVCGTMSRGADACFPLLVLRSSMVAWRGSGVELVLVLVLVLMLVLVMCDDEMRGGVTSHLFVAAAFTWLADRAVLRNMVPPDGRSLWLPGRSTAARRPPRQRGPDGWRRSQGCRSEIVGSWGWGVCGWIKG